MRDAGIELGSFGNFLDFGCGVGSNTRVLMTKFQSGLGVDISARMIAEATQYAKADRRQARYVVNQAIRISRSLPTVRSILFTAISCCSTYRDRCRKSMSRSFCGFSRRAALRHSRFRQISYARTTLQAIKRSTPLSIKRGLRRLIGDPMRSEMHIQSGSEIENICRKANTKILASPYVNSTDPYHGGRSILCPATQR